MLQSLIKKCCVFFIVVAVASPVFAQNQNTVKSGPRKQLSTIFLTGLGGAVLGLSTLSFYGRPQDHLGNIAIGFAVGAVIGTLYTTYDTATSPQKYYSKEDFLDRENSRIQEKPVYTVVAYQFEF